MELVWTSWYAFVCKRLLLVDLFVDFEMSFTPMKASTRGRFVSWEYHAIVAIRKRAALLTR
eukprot:scaffold2657_cov89-Amphora_coffeaeformis.AAC.24